MKYLCLLLVLAGCAEPRVVFKPVNVDVPLLRPCVSAPVVKPDFATAHVTSAQTMVEKTQALLIELQQRRAFEDELQAQAARCVSAL